MKGARGAYQWSSPAGPRQGHVIPDVNFVFYQWLEGSEQNNNLARFFCFDTMICVEAPHIYCRTDMPNLQIHWQYPWTTAREIQSRPGLHPTLINARTDSSVSPYRTTVSLQTSPREMISQIGNRKLLWHCKSPRNVQLQCSANVHR